MSYLIRVVLPDTPGSLGQLAESLGLVDADIRSVDVVHVFDDGTAMDDIVLSLPQGALPDTIITAAQQVEGVYIDSLRPFSGTVDRRGQIEMLATVARHRRNIAGAMNELVQVIPKSMTSGWGIVLDTGGETTRVAASTAAPEDDGSTPSIMIDSARVLDPDTEDWIPQRWTLLDSTLAATPITGTSLVLVVGRPGGPGFLASEVGHLRCLGEIIGAILT
ncbi:amino acid-binding ACT domain protein [Corynebacterium mendelii]|uniref:Amino acid-binding ACT domain protein n=1 Tax=Corynebacterium mendelii TaxID=2765362 RepID=A0A939IW69_9CORY|nr:amino acid-binding ACT domain protein [Corynebacterium mendelii]MBN9644976.1 amino acid-binding ACT domain protein [Corynebacterium mendelii]